ncbi:MAG TPA: NAD(P)-dependent oxidoreductase [Acidobacteriaceae bacterium]|nr:NAD(P)-dependent oxidoreductase [Acidobacteriaceae bacterium]
MNIAFLGLGRMGTAMARLLLQSGHSVTVWNRTPQAAAPLVAEGGIHASSIRDAVAHCDIACTMFADDDATEAVVFGRPGNESNSLLRAMPKPAVHLAHGTLSVALSKRLAAAHAEAGQGYVAAPVFGRPNIAAAGRLWVVASGKAVALDRAQPVMKALGRGVTVVGNEPWQAHAFKLGGNMLISAMVQSLSESFVYAEAQGLDRSVFLETINEALFQSPMYANYGKLMLHPPEHAGGTIAVGAKDTRLLREAAAEAHVRLGLADYLQQQFDAAIADGMEQVDWAVGQYRMAQIASKPKS